MILPPKSARKAVRLGCAKTVTSLSHMYALIMSTWIRDAVPSKELKSGLPPWANSFRKNLTAVALQLNDLKETARLARWEGSVRGHWPYEEYNKLVDVQQEMVTVFSQVRSIALRLDRRLMTAKSSPARSMSWMTTGDPISYTTLKSSIRTSWVPL
jgi:hypothetical protein